MESCELTILMPSLNEAETLASCIQKAKKFLLSENIQGEILIADNGSTDGSLEIAKTHHVRVISIAERGYGAALRGGIAAARGRFIIMGDADDSYDFLNLKSFIEKLREGYDLVMGNRFLGGIMHGAMPFLNRYLGNPLLSYLGRKFYKNNIGDFHCGLRGFKRSSFLELGLQGKGMEFASEMIIKATLQNLRITEVPTCLHPDGRSRRPHLRPWRDGWRHLRLLLLFSPRWLFFYPGLMLMIIGLLFLILLSFGPIAMGRITFDIHTMLFGSMFTIAGLQTICFGFFTKKIAFGHSNTRVSDTRFFHILKFFTLERGLLLGLLLLLAGGTGAAFGFLIWRDHAYGILIPTQMMRILIPSITAFILGIQFIFASFFMSVLGLYYKDDYTNIKL